MADVVDTFKELRDLLARIVELIEERAGERYETLAPKLRHDLVAFTTMLQPIQCYLPIRYDTIRLWGMEFERFVAALVCVAENQVDYFADNGFSGWSEDAEHFLRGAWSNLDELYRQTLHELELAERKMRSEWSVSKATTQATHGPDFRSVNWFGTLYEFTAQQAACVKVLWDAWQNGTPVVGDAAVLESAGSDAERLPLVFRGHAALGAMIVEGQTRGTHRLADPQIS